MEKLTQFLLSIGIAVLLPVVVVFGVFTAIPDKDVPEYPQYVSPPSCLNQYNRVTGDSENRCSSAQQAEYNTKQKAYEEAMQKREEAYKENNNSNIMRAELALSIGVAMFIVAVMARAQSKELSAGLIIGASVVVLGGVGVIAAQWGQVDSSSAQLAGSLFTLAGFVVLSIMLGLIERTIKEDAVTAVSAPDKASEDHSNDKALMVLPHNDSTEKKKQPDN